VWARQNSEPVQGEFQKILAIQQERLRFKKEKYVKAM